MFLFGSRGKPSVGIDIGTTAIKVVQLELVGGKPKLAAYGEIRAEGDVGEETIQSASLAMPPKDIAEMIRELMREAKVSPKNVTVSIPVFEAFINLIEMPAMQPKELAQALPYTARQYVPIPIEEVTLDWNVISQKQGEKGENKFEVLLIAIPNEAIKRAGEIAKLAKFELKALEVESFGLSRALVGQDTSTVCVLDVGAKSSDIVIVEGGFVRASHNFDTAGYHLSDALARTMNVSFQRAESVKHERGLSGSQGEKDILEVMTPLLDLIVLEVQQVLSNYGQTKGSPIQKIVLSGGSARLPGLAEYFAKSFSLPVSVGDPFAGVEYAVELAQAVREIGPAYAVAAGLAMRDL